MDLGPIVSSWLAKFDPSSAPLDALVFLLVFGVWRLLTLRLWPWFTTEYWPNRRKLSEMRMAQELELDRKRADAEIAQTSALVEIKVLVGQLVAVMQRQDMQHVEMQAQIVATHTFLTDSLKNSMHEMVGVMKQAVSPTFNISPGGVWPAHGPVEPTAASAPTYSPPATTAGAGVGAGG